MLVLALLLGSAAYAAAGGVAHAAGDDAVSRARTHFEAGRALYNLGNYQDAIREFSAGYQLAPRPQFLLNLGQAYRKLGQLEKARDLYKRFLTDAPPDDPDRGQVQQILIDLEGELARQPPPALTPIPELRSTPAALAATPTPPAPAATLTVHAEPPPRKSFLRRNWWIFPVGAVVLAGAAVGIYFAVRPSNQLDCSGATLGCVHTMP